MKKYKKIILGIIIVILIIIFVLLAHDFIQILIHKNECCRCCAPSEENCIDLCCKCYKTFLLP